MTAETKRAEAKMILQSPHKGLVLTALSYVNLTDQEFDVLILRHMRGQTQEVVAEKLHYTTNGLQKIEYKALDKCYEVWKNMLFVREILKTAR